MRQGLEHHMERKRGIFKVKFGNAPIRRLFGHIKGSATVISVP